MGGRKEKENGNKMEFGEGGVPAARHSPGVGVVFLTRVLQSPLAEIRPLVMKAKRKKVSRPPPNKMAPNLTTLDSFLE